MAFPERLLSEHETLILDLRPHWIGLVLPVAVVVADSAGRLSLSLEALHHVAVAGERGVQHLDRHAAIDAYVLAFEDGAHAALADHLHDAILVV